MEYLHEYALLLVVAIPVLVIAGLNLYLWLSGERGTLLVPALGKFPAVLELAEAELAPRQCVPAVVIGELGAQQPLPANDGQARSGMSARPGCPVERPARRPALTRRVRKDARTILGVLVPARREPASNDPKA